MSIDRELEAERILTAFFAVLAWSGLHRIDGRSLDDALRPVVKLLKISDEYGWIPRWLSQRNPYLQDFLYRTQVYQGGYWEAPEYRYWHTNLSHPDQWVKDTPVSRERYDLAVTAFKRRYLKKVW